MKIKILCLFTALVFLLINFLGLLNCWISVTALLIIILFFSLSSIIGEIYLKRNLKLFSESFQKLEKGDFSARIYLEPGNILFDTASDFNSSIKKIEYILKEQNDKSWDLYQWNENLGGIIFQKESTIKEIEQNKSQLEQENKALDKITKMDSLTQLYNHKYIYERLEQEINKARTFNKKLSVVMFDIDHFKSVNDNYGHQTGDKVILAVTHTLKELCRKVDILGRYGGEEFLAILPDTDLDGAFLSAERIRNKILSLEFEEGLKISISGGLAQFKDEDALALVKKADELLYKAKENGRNRMEK